MVLYAAVIVRSSSAPECSAKRSAVLRFKVNFSGDVALAATRMVVVTTAVAVPSLLTLMVPVPTVVPAAFFTLTFFPAARGSMTER